MSESKTILVVDDDHELRSGLKAVLQKRGFRTLEADDGLAAKLLISGQRPDLVILDMMMPRWGGFAVLEHFQDHVDAPPFIMITGNEGEGHKAYAEKIGAADFIYKPFSMDRLLEGVDKILGEPAPEAPPAPEQPAARPALICRCSGCGARIKAPIQLLGKKRPCPNCRQELVVRPQPPEDQGPTLVMDDREPVETRRPASGLFGR